MKGLLKFSLIVLGLFIPAASFVAQSNGVDKKAGVNTSRGTSHRPGYHGPAKLGPLDINTGRGVIQLDKLLSMIGRPATTRNAYICYYDAGEKSYLIVERGADGFSSVRGLTLSRINICPEGKIIPARGFSAWSTETGIKPGSSWKDVVAQYGEPTEIDDSRTNPKFYLSPYPPKQGIDSVPREGRLFSYLAEGGEVNTAHAFFGIQNGVVVWVVVSDNE